MSTLIQTPRGELVNPTHVLQIEEVRTTRTVSLILFDAAGKQLAALPAPFRVPPGFVQTEGATPFSGRGSDVRRSYVNLEHVARIGAADAQGVRLLYGTDGRSIGVVHDPLDLTALSYRVVMGTEPEPALPSMPL